MAMQKPELTVMPAQPDPELNLDMMSPVELRLMEQQLRDQIYALIRSGAPLRQRLYLQGVLTKIQEKLDIGAFAITATADFTEQTQRDVSRVHVRTMIEAAGAERLGNPQLAAVVNRIGQNASDLMEQLHLNTTIDAAQPAIDFRSDEVGVRDFFGHLLMGRMPDDLARKARGGRW